jgi:hypothetical protein
MVGLNEPLAKRYFKKSQGFFFGLFYSCYWVIFPIENSILFFQSTGKNSKLKVTK